MKPGVKVNNFVVAAFCYHLFCRPDGHPDVSKRHFFFSDILVSVWCYVLVNFNFFSSKIFEFEGQSSQRSWWSWWWCDDESFSTFCKGQATSSFRLGRFWSKVFQGWWSLFLIFLLSYFSIYCNFFACAVVFPNFLWRSLVCLCCWY